MIERKSSTADFGKGPAQTLSQGQNTIPGGQKIPRCMSHDGLGREVLSDI